MESLKLVEGQATPAQRVNIAVWDTAFPAAGVLAISSHPHAASDYFRSG